jgi:two-component system sensor histidine kinase YesM
LLLFLLGPFLFFIAYSVSSFILTRALMDDNMQVSIQSDLLQSLEKIEKARRDLLVATEQLAIGKNRSHLAALSHESNPYRKSVMILEIKNEMSVIEFTNSDFRILGYYDLESESMLYSTAPLKEDWSLPPEPLLYEHEFTFYGPMVSNRQYRDDLVLGVIRAMPYMDMQIVVYGEIALVLKTENLFMNDADIIILDSEGELHYSSFEEGGDYLSLLPSIRNARSGTSKNKYWAKIQDPSGYQLALVISKEEYARKLRTFIIQIGLIVAGFAVFFAISGLFVWRTTVRPLNIFKREMQYIREGNIGETAIQGRINIPEYDWLLDEFALMRKSIVDLLKKTENDEKERARLKLNRLLYQINPHFLLNTLDTIHWLAVESGTEKIDNVATAMKKLLHYNLKSDGQLAPLMEEFATLEQYVALQRDRFEFFFKTEIPDQSVLSIPVPRFILQPLVENALYHGIAEGGTITAAAFRKGDCLCITVSDDGPGIPPEELQKISDPQGRVNGELGIGIGYVTQVLAEQYGEKAGMEIESQNGQGTFFSITIPLEKQGND